MDTFTETWKGKIMATFPGYKKLVAEIIIKARSDDYEIFAKKYSMEVDLNVPDDPEQKITIEKLSGVFGLDLRLFLESKFKGAKLKPLPMRLIEYNEFREILKKVLL